jgi:predicted small metal-binding protein
MDEKRRGRRRLMGQKYVNCRELSGDMHCSAHLVANNDAELMEVVIKHAINVHGLANTTDFRKQVSDHVREGSPPI